MVIAEEFGEWEDSRRRIDLLGLDKDANLVVIELKRTEDGGHMELQSLRYAAMVSAMTFEQVVEAHAKHLRALGFEEEDAETRILEFLDWDEADEELFAQDVRVVLASAEFSRELTTSVIWLNDRGIDFRCVRLQPYADGDRVFLDVQQLIPLPEAEEYQVRLREKIQRERSSRKSSRDYSRYDVISASGEHRNLPKRWAVLRVVQALCESGVDPDEITRAATFRQRNWAICCSGEYRSPADMIPVARSELERQGRTFDERRWHLDEGSLICVNGKTVTVSNQWGGRAIEWVKHILEQFPGHDVKIKPHETVPASE